MSRKNKALVPDDFSDSSDSSDDISRDSREPSNMMIQQEAVKSKPLQRQKVVKKQIVVSSSESEDSEPPAKPVKPKRVLSEAQKKALEAGREKARLRKIEINAEINKKKADKKADKEQRIRDLEEAERLKTEDMIVKKAIKIKKQIIKKKKALEVSSSESDDSESESEDEKPKPKPRAKRVSSQQTQPKQDYNPPSQQVAPIQNKPRIVFV